LSPFEGHVEVRNLAKRFISETRHRSRHIKALVS